MPKHNDNKKTKINPGCCARGCLKKEQGEQELRKAAVFTHENAGGYMPIKCCQDNKTYVFRAILDEQIPSIRLSIDDKGIKSWTPTAIKNRDNFIQSSLQKCY